MDATAHPIRARHKAVSVEPSAISDFILGPGRPIPAEALLGDGWMPYCLDFTQGLAAFVRCGAETEILSAPFLYAAQFAAAEEIALLPIADFTKMGQALPAPERLAILYSTGRAGSTLASRIFAELPGVVSLSEADITHNAVFEGDRKGAAELAPVIAAGLAFLAAAFGASGQTLVLKPRSQLLFAAAAMAHAAPLSKRAFLYRDVRGYAASIYRFVQRIGYDVTVPLRGAELARVWRIVSGGRDLADLARIAGTDDVICNEELSIIIWQLHIDAYLVARAAGHDITPVHYDDLSRDRLGETARLLAATGIDPGLAPQAMAAFERDAHAGGDTANEVPTRAMDDAARARMEAMIARLGCPDLDTGRL